LVFDSQFYLLFIQVGWNERSRWMFETLCPFKIYWDLMISWDQNLDDNRIQSQL